MGIGRRFYHRADVNAAPLWKFARRIGASVQVLTNVGNGCFDAYLGFQGRDVGFVDAKQPGENLNDNQKDWVAKWRGAPTHVVRTGDDLVRLLFNAPDHPFALGDPYRYEVVRVNILTGHRTVVAMPDKAAR